MSPNHAAAVVVVVVVVLASDTSSAIGIAKRHAYGNAGITSTELARSGVLQRLQDDAGIVVGELLGGGGSGSVFAAPPDLAVKFARLLTDADRRQWAQECQTNGEIARLPPGDRAHLATALSCTTVGDFGVLVMPRYATPLASVVATLSVDDVHRVARDVATALDVLHTRVGVVHLDVKVGNVVLDGDGRALLIDFGVVARVGAPTLRQRGTRGSIAPELLLAGDAPPPIATPAADMYGFGVLLYHLVGRRPDPDPALLGYALGMGPRPTLTDRECRATALLCPLISACMSLRAEERPTPRQAINALLPGTSAPLVVMVAAIALVVVLSRTNRKQ
ncbi:Protein kinase domain-containing protein [Plasmodiophora brassicae]